MPQTGSTAYPRGHLVILGAHQCAPGPRELTEPFCVRAVQRTGTMPHGGGSATPARAAGGPVRRRLCGNVFALGPGGSRLVPMPVWGRFGMRSPRGRRVVVAIAREWAARLP